MSDELALDGSGIFNIKEIPRVLNPKKEKNNPIAGEPPHQ